MNHRTLSITIGIGCAALLIVSGGCSSKKEDADKKEVPADETAEAAHGLTPEMASKVLVKVGDTEITVGQFADKLASQSPYLRARYQHPDRRREFLDNMVKFELMALEAKKRGYDKTPDVERVRKQKMVQQMMNQLFEKDGVLISETTEAEIQKYYNDHRAEYHKPEQVRVSHILMKDRAAAQTLLTKLLAKPRDTAYFRTQALEHNEDKVTKHRYGDLRFISRPGEEEPNEPEVPKEIRKVAWTIEEIGGVHPKLVKTDRGFHIVAIMDRRKAYDRTLEEARRSIQNRLWRQRREAAIDKFVKELRTKAKVTESPELLKTMKVNTVQPAVPLVLPTGSPK